MADYTRQEYMTALKAAHAAGNADHARRLVAAIDAMDQSSSIPEQAGVGILKGFEGVMRQMGADEQAILGGAPGMEARQQTLESPTMVDELDAPEPQGPGQRFARRAGETVGGSAPFMGIGPVVGGSAAIIPELVGAGASAVGSGSVAALAPGHPGLEIAGEIIAPLLAPWSLPANAMRIWRGGKKLYDKYITEEGIVGQHEAAMQDAVGRKLGPEEQERLKRTRELQENIPGFKPTMGEALHDTGVGSDLLATQRAMEDAMPAGERAAKQQRYEDNLNAIHEYQDSLAPGSKVAVQQIIDDISGKVTDLHAPHDAELATVGKEQINLGEKLPQTDRMAAGQTLRGREEAMRTEEMQRMGQLADELGLNSGKLALPFDELKTKMADKYGLKRGEDPQNQPQILSIIEQDPNAKIGFNDLMTYRTTINKALMKAVFDKNDLMARKLAGMQHDIDDFIETAAPKQYSLRQGEVVLTDPHIGAAYDTFRSQYKADVVDRFKQGAAYRVRQKNGESFYITPDEKVAGLFWKSPSGAKQFDTTFRGDPDAVAALRDSMLDDLRDSAVRDGKINNTLYDTWMRRHGSALSELEKTNPQIVAEVRSIRNASESLAERAVALESRKMEIDNQTLVKRLSKVGDGTLPPQKIAEDALKNPVVMRQALNTIGADAGARQAWNRVLWDTATSSEEAMEAALKNPSMRMALGDQHVGYLQNIFDATKMSKSSGKMAGRDITGDVADSIKGQTGQGMDTLAAKFWALHTGRAGPVWLMTHVGGAVFRKQRRNAVVRVLKRAIYDMDVAKAMSESLSDRNPFSRPNLKMKGYLFNAGYDMLSDDDESSDAAPDAAPDGGNELAGR